MIARKDIQAYFARAQISKENKYLLKELSNNPV